MKSIKVGLGTCGISAGGELVFDKVNELVESLNLDVEVSETGCNGMCYEEVLLEINDDYDKYLYSKVTPAKVGRIINEHIINNHPVTEWIIKSKEISKEVSFIINKRKLFLGIAEKLTRYP